MRSCTTIARAQTAEGELVLQRLGSDEYVIAVGGRVVMGSRVNQSERDLATLTCEHLAAAVAPRVVVAGLGLGFTAQAALAVLPATALVTVVELTAAIVEWCRGPLAALAGNVLADTRVTAVVGDVFATLRAMTTPVDAVALDLWQGPHERNDHVFTAAALATCRRALAPGGRLGIWSEQEVGGFNQRLIAAGFVAPTKHVTKRGFRHVIYLANVPGSSRTR